MRFISLLASRDNTRRVCRPLRSVRSRGRHSCTHLAREEKDRQLMLRSIGPVWDEQRISLLARGGTLSLCLPSALRIAFTFLPGFDDSAVAADCMRRCSIELPSRSIRESGDRFSTDSCFFQRAACHLFGAALRQHNSRVPLRRRQLFLPSSLTTGVGDEPAFSIRLRDQEFHARRAGN